MLPRKSPHCFSIAAGLKDRSAALLPLKHLTLSLDSCFGTAIYYVLHPHPTSHTTTLVLIVPRGKRRERRLHRTRPLGLLLLRLLALAPVGQVLRPQHLCRHLPVSVGALLREVCYCGVYCLNARTRQLRSVVVSTKARVRERASKHMLTSNASTHQQPNTSTRANLPNCIGNLRS